MLDQEDASQIKRPLPPLVQDAVDRLGIGYDDLLVATDTDLAISGEYQESWLLVSPGRILVFSNDEEDQEAILLKDLAVPEVDDARMDTRVGSAFLEVKVGETYEELVRFSNKHADKFARVASRLRSLSEGKQVKSDPDGDVAPGRCPKCGVRLPDKHMTVCPRCMKRGQVFFRFLGYVRGYWPFMLLMVGLVVATIILNLVPAPLTQVLIDHVLDTIPPKGWFAALISVLDVGGNKVNWLLVLVGALAVARLFMAVFQWLREWLAAWVSSRLGYELRRDVFHKLQEMSVSYHDTHPVGHLMTRCTQDIEALQGFVTQLTSGFGFQILQLISVSVVMLINNPFLTVLAVLPVPLVLASTYIRYHNIVPRYRRYWTNRSSLSGMLHGALNGVRVVKAFAQESREENRFAKYSGRFRNSALELGYANAWFYPVMGWVFQIGSYFIWVFGGLAVIMAMSARTSPSAGALWLGTQLGSAFGGPSTLLALSVPVEAPLAGWRSVVVGLTGDMTKGDLVEFLAYMAMFYAPINTLTQMSTWFTQFTTQAHRVFEVLDEDPEIRETDESVDLEMQGAVRFRQVTFGYDPHIPVLRDVEFRVEPGEMVGIVGHSGSGKSTCINLLMRFHDVNEGEVAIDNVNIQNIRKLSLRRQVGLVAQDPFLFRGTIAENVAYGNPGAAPQQVMNAALAADAHMFITRNHDGYDTMLGERGAGLSGGERQRVAIARALLNNPRILILDEATSSVDTIAEREIQKALEALSLGRTTIAIAHRLSTLRNCDRILVFEEGTIKEQGSHDELIGMGGIYKRLVEIQTQLTSDVESVEALQAIEEINRAEKERRGIENRREERQRTGVPKIQFLNPKNLRIYSKDEGGMRVEYGDETWDNVRAYRCFPVSRPGEFIAMWVGASTLEQKEVGMVRRLKELQPSSRMAVELELAKRYFIHYIQRIVDIKEEMGFLNWHVETDKGEMEFMTRRNDRNAVYDTPLNGHIILDLEKNRYEIEDIDALDPASRAVFQKYVF